MLAASRYLPERVAVDIPSSLRHLAGHWTVGPTCRPLNLHGTLTIVFNQTIDDHILVGKSVYGPQLRCSNPNSNGKIGHVVPELLLLGQLHPRTFEKSNLVLKLLLSGSSSSFIRAGHPR